MNEEITETQLEDRTIAVIRFADGRVRTLESDFTPAQNGGSSYSGADWTTFGIFSRDVEKKVAAAQDAWDLPDAEIEYTHIRRTTEEVRRSFETSKRVTTRAVRRIKRESI